MRPLVAVPGRRTPSAEGLRTPAVAVGADYLAALRRAGADGAVLDPSTVPTAVEALLARFDGVLLVGGGDVDPARYGEGAHAAVYGVDDAHDRFELAVARAAVDAGLPVLAICRGMQVLNVALGGTLAQHITADETTVHHRGHTHEVEAEPGCRTALAMGARSGAVSSTVSSRHHQAVERLGDGLVVTARAADGVIEGVERPGGWVVAVQWHPEETAAEDPSQQGLFDAFVAACRR